MFDDIRPFYDNEIPAAMQRIASDAFFPLVASYVFPDMDVAQVRELVLSIDNIHDFQRKIMYHAIRRIMQLTISEITYGGIENIDPKKNYLFVSNHRDIMLDASLMQNILVDNGYDTSEITFGANLMQGDMVINVGKSNKMFRVERPSGNMRDFYFTSKHLSEYIRTTICERSQSVWIAQRNGRTKNGVDRTDQGIINMFRMSCSHDKIASVADLNILPIAVSYEWEPCDMLKAVELHLSSQGPYVKREGEDLNSILTGIRQYKGHVHFEFCKPIESEELVGVEDMLSNEFNKYVAFLVDKRVCTSYHLMPNNYIAHDMLHGNAEYASFYTPEQKYAFEEHLAMVDSYASDVADRETLREILLGIYANSVDSKQLFM